MAGDVKRIAILGSTGSIGQQTLDVIRGLSHKFEVVGLAGGNNLRLLEQQVKEFHPRLIYFVAKPQISYQGEFTSMEQMASHTDVDLVVVATSGKAGLSPTLAALRAGKSIALANKEALVMAGEMVITAANLHKTQILPVDSEHSAIWQCLRGENSKPQQIILTASGGPFYRYLPVQMRQVTPEQALHHPTWRMGKKVTVDSATLMNKGLEVIEAHWLFSVPFQNIRVLVHPQSIIHSMVEFVDGSIKAQLGFPDMRMPIQHALCYPERFPSEMLPHIDWSSIHNLEFEPLDPDRFPCFRLALQAGELGGTYPAALCAADEVAVDLFLQGRLSFASIAEVIDSVLQQHDDVIHPSLEEILVADERAREAALAAAGREIL